MDNVEQNQDHDVQETSEKPSLLVRIGRIGATLGLATAFIAAAQVVMGENGALTQITDDAVVNSVPLSPRGDTGVGRGIAQYEVNTTGQGLTEYAADVTGQGMTHGDDVSVTQSGESTEQDIHDSVSPSYWNNGIIGNMLLESQESPDTETTGHSEGETAGMVGNMLAESQAEQNTPVGIEQAPQDTSGDVVERAVKKGQGLLLLLIISAAVVLPLMDRLTDKDSVRTDDDTDDTTHDDRAAVAAKWQEFSDRHEAIKRKVYDSTVDWDTVFFYPAINDMTVPQTQALYEAVEAARNAAVPAPSNVQLTDDIAALPYPAAVIELERAWKAAWAYAEKVQQSMLSRKERKTIQKIRYLLDRVQHGGGTEQEQHVVYSRIEKLLGELTIVRVPDRAMQQIEQRTMLPLEYTPTKHIVVPGVTQVEHVTAP